MPSSGEMSSHDDDVNVGVVCDDGSVQNGVRRTARTRVDGASGRHRLALSLRNGLHERFEACQERRVWRPEARAAYLRPMLARVAHCEAHTDKDECGSSECADGDDDSSSWD